ncbi:MAG: GNAT family N-acetyltransferase [Bradymonadaceae bacterium]
MRELTSSEFIERAHEYDAAVAQTPRIDRFCSSSVWVLPAHHAFLPNHDFWIHQSEYGFVALARGEDPHLGTYLHPLEASWALASPIVGPDVARLTRQFVDLCRRPELDWNLLFLSGIAPDSTHFRELVRGFRRDFSLGLGSNSLRRIADLEGGLEGFYSRRSSKFRANLRRCRRRAANTGVGYEYFGGRETSRAGLEHFDRALAIEERSWKAQADTGIIDGPMKVFYRAMLPMLAGLQTLRFMFVTLDGVDIAYAFGGIFQDTFRGLQMSYHDDYQEHSPGSLAQLALIERLCEEGVRSYDLGSDMEYKRQWAEEGLGTVALIVRK